MKRKTIIILSVSLLVVLSVVITILTFNGSSDFRNLSWGMSFDKVKKVESAPLIRESYDKLVYEMDNIEGVSTTAYYNYNFYYNAENSRYELRQATVGIDAVGFDNKLSKRIINAFEEKYGDATDYIQTTAKCEYLWETERTKIRIEQLSNYLMIEYTDNTNFSK